MKGNFTYYNPTKIYFGRDSLDGLDKELPLYGNIVLLVYGGGSIKSNGVYDAVVSKLKANKKTIIEDAGVLANPTIEKMQEGFALVKKHKVDLVLAVGGGSVIDYAKALAATASETGDIWTRFFENQEKQKAKNIPLATVLTMVGTGSEMNGGSVISNNAKRLKLSYNFSVGCYPKFSIINPEFTFSVCFKQMTAGIFDILSHILEQYLSNGGVVTSDYMAEGLLRSLVDSAEVAIKNPLDYTARSNIAWTSTWALNSLIGKGKSGDWNVHQISHGISAITNATHGLALASVSPSYYRLIISKGNATAIEQFRRFAVFVWGVATVGKSDKQIALGGIDCLEKFTKKMGIRINLTQFGVTKSNLKDILNAIHLSNYGFEKITKSEVEQILISLL